MVYDARLVEDLAGVMTLSRATWSPRAPRRARLLAARRPPTCGPGTWWAEIEGLGEPLETPIEARVEVVT
jgi:hypothetical protein